MNTAAYVTSQLEAMKASGISAPELVWRLALLCVGWPYVFGAAGALCTPPNRKSRARSDHPTIVSACPVLTGSRADCSGCKWYPSGGSVRMFDCRGFTRWCAAQAGVNISGAGATSQWNTEENWAAKGTMDSLPPDQLVCLFVRKGTKMEHTGWGLGNETVECSVGVQHFTKRSRKWTHWAVPRGLEGKTPLPVVKPTLRRGSKGEPVAELQRALLARGFELPKYGADGSFGAETEAAVKRFQQASGLTADGVCGPMTWAALDAEPGRLYTVSVPHLPLYQAEGLVKTYAGAWMTEEGR